MKNFICLHTVWNGYTNVQLLTNNILYKSAVIIEKGFLWGFVIAMHETQQSKVSNDNGTSCLWIGSIGEVHITCIFITCLHSQLSPQVTRVSASSSSVASQREGTQMAWGTWATQIYSTTFLLRPFPECLQSWQPVIHILLIILVNSKAYSEFCQIARF